MRFFIIVLIMLYRIAVASGESSDDSQSEQPDSTNAVQISERDMALSELSWEEPSAELLDQTSCPFDSTADAMIVQKEMIVSPQNILKAFSLTVIERKRIKIYSEKGLSYAKFKEHYGPNTDIVSIEASCYNADGTKSALSEGDIIDETVVKIMKMGTKLKAKAFALPGAARGCVIDVSVTREQEGRITPPVFRFHEDIPVGWARYEFQKPESGLIRLIYAYIVTNEPLLDLSREDEDSAFVCAGREIPAIENEPFRLPERNLVSDLCMIVKGFRFGSERIEFGDTWEHLVEGYSERFESSIKHSRKAKKIAGDFKKQTRDEDQLIRLAYEKVRDEWGNAPYQSVTGPLNTVDESIAEDELGPDDKAALLCAILKHLDIPSEVVWICSDNSDYAPMPNFHTLAQFDYTLTYLPSKELFLDPADRGGDIGVMDDALWGRLMCRPMADSNIIGATPETDNLSATMIDIKLTLTDENALNGEGKITFNNQAAIEARRVFRSAGDDDKRKLISDLLFRDREKAVKSFTVAQDSLPKPDQFEVYCDIEIDDFIGDEPDFELFLYPGSTIENTETDYNPPRKYPLYFQSKELIIYDIEWNFEDRYIPLNPDSLSVETKRGLMSYLLFVDYDRNSNRLSVRRQYRRPQKMFQPNFARGFENFLVAVKKCDLSSVIMDRK